MRSVRIMFAASLLLLCSIVFNGAAGAHPATVGDSSRADWFAQGPSAANVGEIARDAAGRGEFVWTDARGDQRLVNPIGATGNITREGDLARFSVTADTSSLYLLARVDRLTGITNDPSPELMVAFDTDAAHTAGATALPDGMATNVDAKAKWEFAIETQFTKTNPAAKPVLYNGASGAPCTTCSAQLVSAATRQGSFIEIAIPWNQLGGSMPAPQNSLRLSVLTFYSDKRAPLDGLASKAIDVLSPLATATELADGTINAYVDVHFNASGDVFAPLLISEFLPDPPTNSDPTGEWIELYNPNSFAVSLNGYKLGDQAYRGGSQGMVLLPNQMLAAGQAVVVANGKSVFQSRYPSVPAGSIIDMSKLTSYTNWASGVISLQNQNSGQPFKESIALLDPSDTIVDLVQYTTPIAASGLDRDNRPIVLTDMSVAPNASYDRCPATQDTNNGGLDFVAHLTVPEQTPGVACQGVPGVDLRIAEVGPEVVATGSTVQYMLAFSNAGTGPEAANSVVITGTLPSGLTFVSQSSATPGLVFNGTGANAHSPSWSIPTLAPGTQGMITINATVSGALAPNTLLVNTAGITSTPVETPATRGNNFTTLTSITEGPPDLAISSTWPAVATPGSQFTFTIDYANNGEDDASDVVITDQLPANVRLLSASAPGLSFNNATSGALVWRTSALSFGEEGTITLTVQVNKFAPTGSKLTNQITASSTPADSPTTNNSETKSLTVGKSLIFIPVARRI